MSATLSDNVLSLEKDGKQYFIMGTAHISQKSVQEVEHLIKEIEPDTVCVELCPTRHAAITDDSQWRKLDVFKVLKEGKALLLLANLALASFQRKMGEDLGVKPGAELLAAVESAKAQGAELVLADREIQITLKRTWGNLSFLKKMRVITELIESLFSKDQITEEELESLKEKDQLSAMMEEFAKVMPEVKQPLIDERDQYLMSKIEEAPGEKIVAVVGAGHVAGMQNWFGKQVDRSKIEALPASSKLTTIFKWGFPAIILALFAVGFQKHQGQGLEEMLWAWILPNSILCALASALVGAKWPAVIAGFFAAPITSLNPSLPAGAVVGLTDAWFRKPRVEDCEKIPEDIKSFKGFYNNPVTRVLLVFAVANMGSAIGSWIGLTWLVSIGTR